MLKELFSVLSDGRVLSGLDFLRALAEDSTHHFLFDHHFFHELLQCFKGRGLIRLLYQFLELVGASQLISVHEHFLVFAFGEESNPRPNFIVPSLVELQNLLFEVDAASIALLEAEITRKLPVLLVAAQ